jgi:hypothetical protein
VAYAFTIHREDGVDQPYGFADARRMLGVVRAVKRGVMACRISEITDTETGEPVSEAELAILVAAGKGDG